MPTNQSKQYFLNFCLIILGLLVISNYLTALVAIDIPLPAYLVPLFTAYFILGFTNNLSHLASTIIPVIYFLIGILYLLIISYKKRTSRITTKQLILHILFVVGSYLALLITISYSNYTARQTKEKHDNETQIILAEAEKSINLEFQKQKIPRTSGYLGTISINLVDVNKIPQGKYAVYLTTNLNLRPILVSEININPKKPFIKFIENSEPENKQYTATQTENSMQIQFTYDNTGPATDLTSATIILKYQESGGLYGREFFKKEVNIN